MRRVKDIEPPLSVYLCDPGTDEFNFPAVLAAEFWEVDRENRLPTVAYLDVDGTSPETINHLSKVRFNVIAGSGEIATKHVRLRFCSDPIQASTARTIIIGRGEAYRYSGRFQAMVGWDIPPYEKFIQYDDRPLARPERRLIASFNRIESRERVASTFQQLLIDEFKKLVPSLSDGKMINLLQIAELARTPEAEPNF